MRAYGAALMGAAEKTHRRARDWAELGQDTEGFKALGFTDEDLDIEIELWPENALPMQVFMAMQTQWRIGMGGATGLDYSALRSLRIVLTSPKNGAPSVLRGCKLSSARCCAIWGEAAKSAAKRITGNNGQLRDN
ncbi:DUF1799 domain-containing protein [Dentiradicibacter hellwigii]|uniref:DUF1799 domain-containing protein n=1 Tax=Dentiradicibacter hellwigii TaxID=3149053 RepID=A0ABV4UJJ0_9RHOO